jgi:esterase/lipase superfamily enzyme
VFHFGCGTVEIPELPPGVKGYREVFFVTDREPAGISAFRDRPARNEQVSYGRTIVSIPESHEIGELERPWQLRFVGWSQDESISKHITIADRELLDVEGFRDAVARAIDDSPEESAFVFIHGYNVSFDESILRTGQLAWDLKFRGPAITYSWPSAARTGGYVSDMDIAEWAAPHLRDFLLSLRTTTGTRMVHLIAHSMGGRVLTRALEQLTASAASDTLPQFQEVVLAAPDTNVDVFAQLAPAMRRRSERVTIYSSTRDRALLISAAIRGQGARVGGNASEVPGFQGVDVIDSTLASASLLGHSDFAESPPLLDDLALLIRQRLGPDKRSVRLERSGEIWVLKP